MLRLAVLNLMAFASLAVAEDRSPTPVPPGLAEPTPPRVGRISLGIGEYAFFGPMGGLIQHFSLGVRVTDKAWVVGTYGRPHEIFRRGDEDAHLGEGLLALSHMTCAWNGICFAGNAGLGYQGAGMTYGDDIDAEMPDTVYDYNNVFVEGRAAIRINLGYVWLEASLALREHAHLDPDSAGERAQSGFLLGIALHVTP